MVALLVLVQEEFSTFTEELNAVWLPHGYMIFIPDLYWRKLIMSRCKSHQDLYSSRLMLEHNLLKTAMPREQAERDVHASIIDYWSWSPARRAELEARYQGLVRSLVE